MTSEQYWHGDPWLVETYCEAHNIQVEMRNQELYMQGAYNFQAFSTALANFGQGFSKHKKTPHKYLDKPIRITPLSRQEKLAQQEAERQKTIKYFSDMESKWNKA